MRHLEIQILPLSKIGWSEPSALQTWSALLLKISDHVALGYPDHPCFLPSWKCVDHTIELNTLPVQQRLGPSCWGSLCRCKTCTHDIWGGWYTPRTTHGCWTYLLPLLWPIQTHLCARLRSSSQYHWYQSGKKNMNIYGLSKGMNPSGACSPGFSQATSVEANEYSSIVSITIEFFFSAWKLLLKPAVIS